MFYKQRHLKAHLKAAQAYAELSYAKRLKVGALLVRGNAVLATGWNGRLPGEPNVCEDENGVTLPDVRHAEINALNKLRNTNESSSGAILVQTHSPCIQCALDIISSNVVGVVFTDKYRDDSGIKKLLLNGLFVYQYVSKIDRFFSFTISTANKNLINCVMVDNDFSLRFPEKI